ncbi:MAG: hypothetical protein ACRDYC_08525 [Acidimicrobiales bacterium]
MIAHLLFALYFVGFLAAGFILGCWWHTAAERRRRERRYYARLRPAGESADVRLLYGPTRDPEHIAPRERSVRG